MSVLRPSFSIVRGSWDTCPQLFRMAWPDLAERLARHDVGEKDGTALICGLYNRPEQEEIGNNGWRRTKYLAGRELIALDIEQQEGGPPPPDPEIVANRMKLAYVAGVIWTTHSHKRDAPRYRIVMPLIEPIAFAEINGIAARSIDRACSAVVAHKLKMAEYCDRGKFGASSLMYLARHPEGSTDFGSWIVEGTPLEVTEVHGRAIMSAQTISMRDAQKQALANSRAFPEEVRQRIEAYNDGHDIEALLVSYGYTRHGERFKSPYQHPNSAAATSIYQGNLATSFSESDKAAGLGTVADSGECIFFDCFGAFLHFSHRGNFRAALRAIGGNPNAASGDDRA